VNFSPSSVFSTVGQAFWWSGESTHFSRCSSVWKLMISGERYNPMRLRDTRSPSARCGSEPTAITQA